MRGRFVAAGLVVVGMVGLAGCGSGTSSSGGTSSTSPASPAHELTNTAWVLKSYRGSSGAAVTAVAGAIAALAFKDHGALNGSTGCNQIAGTYVANGRALAIKTGAMTLIGCTSEAVSAQETAILQQLPQVATYTITADTLKLAGSDGATLLIYEAGLSGLAGTSWTATGVNNGRQAVVGTAGTEQLTATFGVDGAFTGFGGCNNLSGSYAVSGTSGLTISGIAATQMACAADVDQLETQYTTALGQVAEYAISGDQLTLRNRSGETQVTYRFAG